MGDEEYRDKDGTLLLMPEEVAKRAGVSARTIRKYNSDANLLRKQRKWTVSDLPKPSRHVLRRFTKANGLPGATWSSLFREDEIELWMANRRGPRGRIRGRGSHP